MASKHYQLLTCALLSACEQLIQLLNFVNTWIFLFRWMHMLVYCSSALFNKLMFWGLYWHLTAWLELMWLNSWKNTMGFLSPLPRITVGEEGLVNTWADLYSVVQLFQWNADKTTFEAWACSSYLSKLRLSVWADFRAFLCVWKALVSEGSEAGAAFCSCVFRREMHVFASLVLVSSLE